MTEQGLFMFLCGIATGQIITCLMQWIGATIKAKQKPWVIKRRDCTTFSDLWKMKYKKK